MPVIAHTKGCRLFNYNYVITRDAFLYLLIAPFGRRPGPWGGALVLYPAWVSGEGMPEPEAILGRAISPSWNPFIIQSTAGNFHSAEEVVVWEEGEDGSECLSLGGCSRAARRGLSPMHWCQRSKVCENS